jgi:hypothetical protein
MDYLDKLLKVAAMNYLDKLLKVAAMNYLDKLLKVAAMNYLDKLLKVAARILERPTGKRHLLWVGWVSGLVSSPKNKGTCNFSVKPASLYTVQCTLYTNKMFCYICLLYSTSRCYLIDTFLLERRGHIIYYR